MNAAELHSFLLDAFRRLEQEQNHRPWSPRHPLRQRAVEAFQQLGFPTTRHEDWKYTSLAPVLRYPYRIELPPAPDPAELRTQLLSLQGMPPVQLWLLNGRAYPEQLPRQVHCSSFQTAGDSVPTGHIVPVDSETFPALNAAFAPDVIALRWKEDAPELLHIAVVAISRGEPQMSHPRLSLAVEPQRHAQLLLSLHATGDAPCLTNLVAEVALAEGAHLDLVLWEVDPAETFAITTLGLELARAARLRVWTLALGGALLRNNLYIRLVGPGADAQLFGATMVAGHQVIDHRTLVEHRVEQCTSNQLYKSVAEEEGTVTFTGRIHVYPGAQKTNAYQSHRALLLSPKATVNARPQLEIYADDVRCTHGATTGALDAEALFYLRSRGIPESRARALLLHAFVQEAFQQLPEERLRQCSDELIAERAHLPAESLS